MLQQCGEVWKKLSANFQEQEKKNCCAFLKTYSETKS